MERSVFSKRHPLVILIYLLGAMIVTMWTMHIELLAISVCVALCYALRLRGIRPVLHTLVWGVLVLFFMAVLLPLFRGRGDTPLFYINGRVVSFESVMFGLMMTMMLLAIFLWFQVGNVWLDSEKNMYLFGRHFATLGLIVSRVLRLLPLLKKRYQEIGEAQQGLGLVPEKKSVLARARYITRQFSVLLSWSLEGAIETSIAMESRGYGVGRRTSFHLFTFRKVDAIYMIIFLALYGSTIFFLGSGAYDVSYFPCIEKEPMTVKSLIGMGTFLVATVLPFVVDLVKGGNHE